MHHGLPAVSIRIEPPGGDGVPEAIHLDEKKKACFEARMTHRLTEWMREASDEDRALPTRADQLHASGDRLSKEGRREEALEAMRESVALFRDLAQRHPEAFLPSLATHLRILSDRLRQVGRQEEAVACAREADELQLLLKSGRTHQA